MSPHALRRWFARHPGHWVLSLALGLGLALGGAQLVAACHEISHVAASEVASGPDRQVAHAANGHDCPTCLLAAALGGAATAPPALALAAPDAEIAAPPAIGRDFTPRVAHAYASRAPPRA